MSDERPDVLLKSALEKIVYFEARAGQLHHELTATRQEVAHLKQELVRAEQREVSARREVAELEVKAARQATEREELTRLNQVLRSERDSLLDKLLEASRIRASDRLPHEEDDSGIDLASFISQLRSEALGRPAAQAEGPVVPVPALAVAGAPSQAGLSPVAQHAWRLHREGRLEVSPGQLVELGGGRDETLFGFSVSELGAVDATSRVRAAERLKALGQAAAAPVLASALHAETEPTVQVALLQAFAEVGREEGAAVVSSLLGSPVPDVRMAALKALLVLAPHEAAPHLAQAVRDPDRAVRRRASLLALGLDGESARRLGEEAIHDEEPEVRRLAALALGAGSGEGARLMLLEALKDSEVRVRRAAAQSLGRIFGQDVSAVAELEEGRRRREIRRLAGLPVQPVRATLPPRAVPVARAEPVAAQPVPRTTRPGPSPVEALGGRMQTEIRAAIRGRTQAELVSGLSAPPELAGEALALLVARGAVVRRGHKYFAA